jgi:hypothetical protein
LVSAGGARVRRSCGVLESDVGDSFDEQLMLLGWQRFDEHNARRK